MRDGMKLGLRGSGAQAGSAEPGLLVALAACAVAILIIVFGFWASDPSPAPQPADAPAETFSAARALEHVKVLAREPRPSGSAAHGRARDYVLDQLRSLGLEPEVQQETVLEPGDWGSELSAVKVENILVRLPGAAGPAAKSLLVMGHYDSVPTGPGAADDASSVASILETLRALRAGPALPHDVLFLFSDAEELGLYGAFAFARHHPWTAQVGLVLNFEARGNGGPVRMFRTSEGNRWLIGRLASAAPQPVASSLYYEAFKRMPNNTDLTAFLRSGIPGMDFAFIGGFPHYHSAMDTADALSLASVQHQGSYLLSLIRTFSAEDLTRARGGEDAIYFNPAGGWLVVYPVAWALPLAVLAGILFLVVLFFGARRRRLRTGLVLGGFGGTLLAGLVCAGLGHLLWQQVFRADPDFRLFVPGMTYDLVAYLWGFSLLAVGLAWAVCRFFTRRGGETSFAAGAALVWLLATAATSVLMPGVSYLFLWPMVFALGGIAWTVTRPEEEAPGWGALLVAAVAALPVLLLLPPLLAALFHGLGVGLAGGLSLFVGLGVALISPLWGLTARRFKIWLPASLIVAGLGILGWAAATTSSGNARQPSTDTLLYGLDSGKEEAWWFTYDRGTDAWTAGFLGSDPVRMPLPGLVPWEPRNGFLSASAPTLPLPPPRVELIERSEDVDPYRVAVRLRSDRQAPVMYLSVETLARIETVTIDGRRWDFGVDGLATDEGGTWVLRHIGAGGEPVEVVFELDQRQPLELRLVDQSFGLPPQDGAPAQRPAGLMADPFQPLSDVTLVTSKVYY